LAAAVLPFQTALESSRPTNPALGRLLFAGGQGSRIFQTAGAIPDLAAQVARPLDWAASLEALGEAGVDRLLDLGPGHALADMARTALPETRSYAADAFHSLEGLRAWLAAPAGAAGPE
jgi:[acyl-carrier-protein] S-malonyltransferase